ncbi:uncharacterized protein LOC128954347 [Oppia nitens]|uniref:uncharacterized protein LOC128954347 n=1 Tax=Oppia nitens TaxID=1686743 RepID=UPI0023DA4A48|nr:uncharacterized protein LOC128954347 [Oppia nitens]
MQSLAFPEESREVCVPKERANKGLELSCDSNDNKLIAIYEAFLTTSWSHRCPDSPSFPISAAAASAAAAVVINTSDNNNNVEEEEDEDDANKYAFPRMPTACTDDLRLSLNRKCSGVSNCTFSLLKDHNSQKCMGEDSSVIIKYTCISADRYHPYCNQNFTANYGYIANPGYPKYYPPYENCAWTITGGEGQVVQVDILDVAIKEPDPRPQSSSSMSGNGYSGGSSSSSSSSQRKKVNYKCSDQLVLMEAQTQMLSLCGEVKTNLVQYRTKSNKLTISFNSYGFSPTRGLLLRYSLQNCPTLPAPRNGHLITRNGSFAYYSCCLDYVFEDTKQSDRILYCEYGNHWNSSLSQCISTKELSMSSSLTLSNDSNNPPITGPLDRDSDDYYGSYYSDILIPILLMIALLAGNAVIIWVLFRLKRKQKSNGKSIEANVPLTTGSAKHQHQTNV